MKTSEIMRIYFRVCALGLGALMRLAGGIVMALAIVTMIFGETDAGWAAYKEMLQLAGAGALVWLPGRLLMLAAGR